MTSLCSLSRAAVCHERQSAPEAHGPGARRLLALALLALLAAQAVPLIAQTCATGGTSALPPPIFDALRGYRASFSSPTRLAVDELGQVYVADPARGTVLIRAADGRLVALVEELGSPSAIAVEADGNRIYVGDRVDGRVTAYSGDWVPLFHLGSGNGELAFPGDIALDPQTGHLWVTDSSANRVKVYDATGNALFGFGARGTGPGQFLFPTGIFVDAVNDEVLVADQLNGRIQIFDRQGGFVACIGEKGSGAGRLNMPQGLWADGNGRIYVSDAFEGWIHVVDRQGASVAFLGEVGQGPGQLSTPSDLLIDPSGRLFVSSTTTARLEIFGLDSYSDPERFAPAEVELSPNPLPAASTLTATIEVPGYRLELVAPQTVTANGVPSIPGLSTVGDVDGDHVPDVSVVFDGAAVAATLPSAGGEVRVTGQLGELDLEGWADLALGGGAPSSDSDGDGVADSRDSCPATPAGAPVSARGCSLAQLCPCGGPSLGDKWQNHGAYVSCVSTRVREITHPPLDNWERMQIIKEAARSSCGRKAVSRS